MVKVNELRIGNWINDDEGGPVRIERLQSKEYTDYNGGDPEQFYFTKNNDMAWCCEKVFGIPLTPEVLEAIGFEKKMSGHYYKLGFLYLSSFEPNQYLWCDENGVEKFAPMPLIKYLHQLQNLYFALTGQELTINIPIAQKSPV